MKDEVDVQKCVTFYKYMQQILREGFPGVLLHLEDGVMVADVLNRECLEKLNAYLER